MNWSVFIEEEGKKEYYKKLMKSVDEEYRNHVCYPEYKNIFRALELTSMDDVKVVILGQDPYHEKGQAHGLAFSVETKKLPPSLINIYREMQNDLEIVVRQDGNLEYLAKQGVLLLNTILTVREKEAFSHKDLGWEIFTDNIISLLNSLNQPIVFILWGAAAQAKKRFLNNPNHLILTSAHPSPLSSYRGFFGSKPFSKTNEYLRSNGIKPIEWIKA